MSLARPNCFPLIAFSSLPFGGFLSLSFNHGSTLSNLVLNPEIVAPLSLLSVQFQTHSYDYDYDYDSSE